MINKAEITLFKHAARQLLIEETAWLKDSFPIAGKLARLAIFNEHLVMLKMKLQAKMDSMLEAAQQLPSNEYTELEAGLRRVFTDSISEYLFISFRREDEENK